MMPMEELVLLCTRITAAAAALTIVWKLYCRFAAIVEGIRCQLRSEMLRTYYHNKDTGCIRQYEAENFERNFSAYTALGGNSFIDNVHKEVSGWEIIS